MKSIKKMGKLIGFDYVYWDDDPDRTKANKSYVEISKKCKELTQKKIPHMLVFYFGGHGVTEKEKQFMVLNSDDPKKALIPI